MFLQLHQQLCMQLYMNELQINIGQLQNQIHTATWLYMTNLTFFKIKN